MGFKSNRGGFVKNYCKYKIYNGQTWRHKDTKKEVFIDFAYKNGIYWSQDGKQHFSRIDDFVLHYEKRPTFCKTILKVFKRGGLHGTGRGRGGSQ